MRGTRDDAAQPRAKSLFDAPAIRALAFQLAAGAAVAALALLLALAFHFTVPLAVAALAQGTVAALLSWRRLASWWIPIQFFFPVAAVALNALQLPPAIFLACFLFFVVLYWSTFRTQVPFYPSNRAVREAVAALLPRDRPVRIIDIGSGFGGLVLHVGACRPDAECVGIELAPLPWLASCLRAALTGSRGRFIRGDYHALDFAQFDVVFAYLSPAAMPALWDKARAEMRSGTLLLSYEFPIPGTQPQLVHACGRSGVALYGWTM